MLNKPRCRKAQTKKQNMALYCEGKALCAHQYYCQATKQYENTPGFESCKRLNPEPVIGFHTNVLPQRRDIEVTPEQPIGSEVSGLYVQNIVPVEQEETKTAKKSERRQKDGKIRNNRRRDAEKG